MSFHTYPMLKPSGLDWVGTLPAHWEVLPLKRIVTMRSGEMIGPDKIEDAGTYPVYGGNGLRGYTSAYTHEGTYVLVGRQGALCGNVNYASGRFWASEHAIVATPLREMPVNWLGELLRAMNLGRYSTSAAQPGIGVEMVANLSVGVPPLPEQTAIAAFLDREAAKIDELVEEQKRLIELLKEKCQAVISQAVTKGLNTDAPMKDSGVEWLGEVPEYWDVRRLGGLFREVAEAGNEELPIFSVSIHHGVSDTELDDDELDRKVSRSDDRSKYKRVRPGDLVYNMMRAWQGGFGSVQATGMVSPAYVVARPKAEFLTEFVEALLRTPAAVEEMRRRSRGITDFRLRLYWDEFKDLRIAIPPASEQRRIMEVVATHEARSRALIVESEHLIELLRERRSALISAAVTGKVDVRDIAAAYTVAA